MFVAQVSEIASVVWVKQAHLETLGLFFIEKVQWVTKLYDS